MPQFDKLLTDVGPDDPPARAAQRALKTRLRAVAYYLDCAAADRDQAEQIHQLRIWTRRSAAALALFGPLLPAKKSRRLKKALRKLRQTAGTVRDLDVFQEQLGGALEGPLSERLAQQRQAANQELTRLVRRWGKKGKLKRKSKRLLRRLERSRRHAIGVDFGLWCRAQFAPLTEDFSRYARRGPRQSDARLHQWRLATKRLKYALELAVAALPKKTWSRLYALLGELQDRLGRICDALLEQRRLNEWRQETSDRRERSVLRKLGIACRTRLSRARRDLANWWTRERRESYQLLQRKASLLEGRRRGQAGTADRP